MSISLSLISSGSQILSLSRSYAPQGSVVNNKIDDLDYKILNILANDARIPIAELSRKLDSTIDIIRARIKKLEEKQIILSYRIAVDLNKLGLEFFKAII